MNHGRSLEVFGGLQQPGGEITAGGPRRKTAEEAFADYFGAKIANDNTREAYLRDAKEFAAESLCLISCHLEKVAYSSAKDYPNLGCLVSTSTRTE